MSAMVTCAFTGAEIPPGTGKMFIKKDGRVLYFKNRKAEKNYLKLKRNPRKVGYTAAARHAKEQRIAELRHEQRPAEEPAAKPKKAKKGASKNSEPSATAMKTAKETTAGDAA